MSEREESYINELISLVEEYKIHGENADAEIINLRNQLVEVSDEHARLQSQESQRSALWAEMEDSVVHMDQEVRAARAELEKREMVIHDMKQEILAFRSSEKSIRESQAMLRSATNDEIRNLRTEVQSLREYSEELEAMLSSGQTELVDLRLCVSELESRSGLKAREVPVMSTMTPFPRLREVGSENFTRKDPFSPSNNTSSGAKPATRSSVASRPDAVSDIDVDVVAKREPRLRTAPETEAHRIISSSALSSDEAMQTDEVMQIKHRTDGLYGFPSSPRHSILAEARWAYPSPNSQLLPPPPPPPPPTTTTTTTTTPSSGGDCKYGEDRDDRVEIYELDAKGVDTMLRRQEEKRSMSLDSDDEMHNKESASITIYKHSEIRRKTRKAESREKGERNKFSHPKTLRA